MTVAIIGTVALDSIDTPTQKMRRLLGGSGSYAGTAASLFTNTGIISIIGTDFPPDYLTFLASRGINLDGIATVEGTSFHWHGEYFDNINQRVTLATDLGVLPLFDPKVPDSLKDARIVFCGNTDPTIQYNIIQHFNKPELIVLDTMNLWIETARPALEKVLKCVDVLIINDEEARLLTGTDNLIAALPQILAMGPKRLIVKKGEHGSLMYNGTTYFLSPAMPIQNVIDPTGAGDCFAGGLVGYLDSLPQITEESFKQGIIAGTLISSVCVQDFSPMSLTRLTRDALGEQFHQFSQFVRIPEFI